MPLHNQNGVSVSVNLIYKKVQYLFKGGFYEASEKLVRFMCLTYRVLRGIAARLSRQGGILRCTLSICYIHRLTTNIMTLQDHFPYYSTITDLDGVFHPVGDDSFFINSPCIIAEDRMISKSKIYWLVNNDANHTIQIHAVRILHACIYQQQFFLLIHDIEVDKVILLCQFLDDLNDYYCGFRLIDNDYLKQKANNSMHNESN